MTRLDAAELARIRRTPDGSVLLFLTDRCPVGCSHCSVDSTPDGATVSDHALLAEIATGLAHRPGLVNVGISGGEPFSERRGLSIAVDVLAPSEKSIALYTSGVWAPDPRRFGGWHRSILERVDTVILSTDVFHAAQLRPDAFRNAAACIARTGAWLIVQVLALPETLRQVRATLAEVLGPDWEQRAEINEIPFMPYGRASAFGIRSRVERAPAEFGRCSVADSPVVRYTGTVVACCSEQVQMGGGPDDLRRQAGDAAAVNRALDGFRDDPQLRLIADEGCGRVAEAAGMDPDARFTSICDFCWASRGHGGGAARTDLGLDVMRR